MKKLTLLGLVVLALAGCGEEKKISTECYGSTITGREYPVLWQSTLYEKKNGTMSPIINEKYKKISGEIDYLSVDSSTTIFEECVNNGFSYIRLISPEYLIETHKGWINEHDLDKGQALENEYDRHISDLVKYPYKKDNFESLRNLLGDDFEKVNTLRYLAAKMVIDNGKCDYVTDSSIDIFDIGTKENLRFVVECRNKSQISIDEKTITNGGALKTDLEKSIPQNIAIERCNSLINSKAKQYGDVDIYSFTGTVFDVNKTNGNASVDVLFDVKNKLGVTEKLKARCLFESGSWNEEIVIHTR